VARANFVQIAPMVRVLVIAVTHVAAGLASRTRTVPEQVSRIPPDAFCNTVPVPEPAGLENLNREEHADEHIILVGNPMIDKPPAQVATTGVSTP